MARKKNKSNNKLKILGIIGARSGSKGIPYKNIYPLAGKPLMAWIIEAAKKSKHINRLIVSTDSPEFAKIANLYGAQTPFLRPADISEDMSPEFEFVKHALLWLEENEKYIPDIIVRLHPTLPMQQAEDIDSCIDELLKDSKATSAVVIAEASQHPERALKIIDDGKETRLVTYITESSREITPGARQKHQKAYFRSNVIACWRDTIFKTNTLTGDFVKYYIIPKERAVDINNPEDLLFIEQVMKRLKIS